MPTFLAKISPAIMIHHITYHEFRRKLDHVNMSYKNKTHLRKKTIGIIVMAAANSAK